MPVVLLAEDDLDTRDLYTMFLRAQGLDVVPAENGKRALEAAGRVRPDVVVTDLAMPVMDGFELMDRLRADSSTRGLPVVAVTGQGPASVRRAEAAGYEAVLVKPCLPEDLLEGIRPFLPE